MTRLRRRWPARRDGVLALLRGAAGAIGAADKRALVTASSDAIGRVTARLAETISAACAPQAFAAIFARDAMEILVDIGTRADSLAGDAYLPPARLRQPNPRGRRGVRRRQCRRRRRVQRPLPTRRPYVR